MKFISYYLILFFIPFCLSNISCKMGQAKSCSDFEKRLYYPAKARDAIRNLGDLKCSESIPALERVFERGEFRSEILGAIKQINDPKGSVSILRKGLEIAETVAIASSIVEDWKLIDLRNDLVAMLKTEKNIKLRKYQLQALISMEELSQHEDLFIKLLKDDPNAQGIAVNILSAEALGKLKSKKAINALILGMFMQTQKGEKMYKPCRKALVTIGLDTVEPLIQTMKGNNEELSLYAKKAGLYDWQWMDGAEIVQVLSDLRDPRISVPLIENMGKTLQPPSGVDERVTELWKITQQNRITMSMIALATIGDDIIEPKAKEIILNNENDTKQRLDTATTLALIGTKKCIDALFEVFTKEKDLRFKQPLLLPMVIALDFANLQRFEKLMAKQKHELIVERFKGSSPEAIEIRDYLKTLKECKEDDSCYMKNLAEGNITEKKKSALMLTRIELKDKKATIKSLISAYLKSSGREVDLRRFILIGIWRLGDKSIIPDIENVIAEEKEKKGYDFWVDEMEMIIPALARK